jgi:hypothetical protein
MCRNQRASTAPVLQFSASSRIPPDFDHIPHPTGDRRGTLIFRRLPGQFDVRPVQRRRPKCRAIRSVIRANSTHMEFDRSYGASQHVHTTWGWANVHIIVQFGKQFMFERSSRPSSRPVPSSITPRCHFLGIDLILAEEMLSLTLLPRHVAPVCTMDPSWAIDRRNRVSRKTVEIVRRI